MKDLDYEERVRAALEEDKLEKEYRRHMSSLGHKALDAVVVGGIALAVGFLIGYYARPADPPDPDEIVLALPEPAEHLVIEGSATPTLAEYVATLEKRLEFVEDQLGRLVCEDLQEAEPITPRKIGE